MGDGKCGWVSHITLVEGLEVPKLCRSQKALAEEQVKV